MGSKTENSWGGILEPEAITKWHMVITIGVTLFVIKWLLTLKKTANVPGIGYGMLPILSSWVAAFRFMQSPVKLVREGVSKYKSGYFRISTLQDEYVLVSSRDKVAEYLRAPDDVLSFQEAANDQQQIPFTMGYGVGYRTYHTSVVRGSLTQSINTKVPAMLEEIVDSFDTQIGMPADYEPFPMYDIIAMTVAKASNRVYVGTRLSRNKEYLQVAIDYAQAVVISAEIVRNFPDWLKRVIIRFAPVTRYRHMATKWLGPIIQERLDARPSYRPEKPNDLVQWLIDAAPPIEKTVYQLVERVMALNVGSIHTTTMTFTSALYSLAAEPEKYISELRSELLKHCEGGAVTKETLPKLVKMDSFLRESGRFNNAGLLSTQRNAKKPFMFSDGTIIPAGAKLGTPALFLHRDETIYKNAEVFDGFRFSRADRDSEGSAGRPKHQMVTTDPAYQLFGHGKHACPGRFFAVNEMKLMFAMLLLRYDMKLAPGTAPKQTFIGTMSIPDTRLKVLIKAREL